MSLFYSRLSYSFGNEDWKTESKALQIRKGDSAVCITASGDRPLHLLLDDCSELVSVDLNPIQNYLLQLKIAAMKNLEFDQYLSFLGINKHEDRKRSLKILTNHMEAEAAQFWLKNEKIVDKGVLFQGAVEKFTKLFSCFVKLIRRKKVNRLFNINCLEEQKKFVKEQWDVYFWRKFFEIAMNPKISQIFFKDPGLQGNLVSSIKPGTYIYDRMNQSMNQHLAKDNLLLSMIFNGKVTQDAFPPYLQKESVEKIKLNLNRLHIKTDNIINFLESEPENRFDCFSLSDVISYVSEDDYRRLVKEVYRTAKPGARFSFRQFLSNRTIPESLSPSFNRNHELEKELEAVDRCFVYRFMVGKIEK